MERRLQAIGSGGPSEQDIKQLTSKIDSVEQLIKASDGDVELGPVMSSLRDVEAGMRGVGGQLREVDARTGDINLVLEADSVWYHDLSLTYEWAEQDMRVIFGVSNMFDEEPPQVSTFGGILATAGRSAFYSQYDWLGQRWFLNIMKSWD